MRFLVVSVLIVLPILAAEWDRFRGPNGSGVAASGAGLPVQFGPSQNVAWQIAVPFGRSSPILAGSRLYLTASEGDALITLAYDATTGKQVWRSEVKRARTQRIFKANDAASPTPTADENGLYVFFPDFGLISYDLASGKERWKQPLGPFDSFYGMASSPVVANGLVVLLCDQAKGSFLAAWDRDTGQQKWKTARKEALDGWAVPIVYKDQLLTFGSARVDSYQLLTGESRWWVPVASAGSMGNPVLFQDSLILTASGSDQPWLPTFAAMVAKLDKDGDGKLSIEESKGETEWFEHFGWVDTSGDKLIDGKEWDFARALGTGDYGAMSIPLDGKGRLDSSKIRWRYKRGLPYVAAPLLYEGVLYMVKDGGIITALNPANGAMLKQGRSPKAGGEYFASPVAADGKIFLLSSEGKLTVLKAAGAAWDVLAVNDLEEESYATPAIGSRGSLYVRTRGKLYAFSAGKQSR